MSDNLKEREAFEAWAKNEFYSGLASVSDTFDNERNCYADFAHHMSFHAFKAGLAAIEADRVSRDVLSGMVRFCPECGMVGEPRTGARDCCPDGSHAAYMPEKTAELCRALFIDAMASTQPQPVQTQPIDDKAFKLNRLMGLIDDVIEVDPDRAERLLESILARNALKKRLPANQQKD